MLVAIACLYVAFSLLTFLVYGFDKMAAIRRGWRVREDTLHMFGILGGWPGAILAQRLLRHKTRKRSFRSTFWGTVFINCAALVWLLSPFGAAWAYRNFGGL
ncbi:DUF1294 domain-containing protein [Kordiimonas gwangyangensis]|uniref:DUF1294 domain-containing protein n=1 Tax=Kordiimonas gwangyangensis TaxID=288022 RepID=UPI0012DEEE83